MKRRCERAPGAATAPTAPGGGSDSGSSSGLGAPEPGWCWVHGPGGVGGGGDLLGAAEAAWQVGA